MAGEAALLVAVSSIKEMLLPFLQILVAADDADLETWALQDFGTNRNQQLKGVVEVTL